MRTTSNEARAIFLEAIEQESPEDRARFVLNACDGNPDLCAHVERLLRSHEVLGSFHDQPGQRAANVEVLLTEKPGTIIGPYKLLQQIGEGGMGVVFMAEQTVPLQRTVALKIIKPGMDTRRVIARFEAERQALAMMDHPNISKVLDAGTTAPAGSGYPGRPYFVMELVKGVPITQYCDEKQLSLRQRLELFLPVCQAVQHAHQKGIIHRDIKPTNVLVAEYDNHAIPKVIDFGVAKATAQKLTERTMFTEFGQLIGTFEYMSPEQAKLNQLDIDTRSDIYSLGVLLYELLTGETPFDRQRLRTAAFDEALRIIREEEPLKPSTKLTTLAQHASSTVSTHRNSDPKRLTLIVRGELDWIVMKCLEKDRNRRYETASALAADVLHFLNDEPVSAAGPSRLYRANKFVRRNKGAAFASAAVLVGLIAGTIGMGIGLVSQTRQRAEAKLNLANALQSQRKYADAEALFRAGLESASSATLEDRQRAARTHLGLAKVVYDRGNADEAERLYRDALAAFRSAFPAGDPNIAHAVTSLALLLQAQQRYADAEPLFREAYEIYRHARPVDHFTIGVSARYLASALIPLGKHAEAEIVLRDGIAAHQLAEPPDEWALAIARIELGRNLISTGKFAEAEAELFEAERVLAFTSDFRYGSFALAALYTAWDQAEPGKGYEFKAQKWYRKHIETFVLLDEVPEVPPKAHRQSESIRQQKP